MKKQHLPEKPCLQCQRPFTWRKKWERCWDEVKYCSKRCQGESKKKAKQKRIDPGSMRLCLGAKRSWVGDPSWLCQAGEGLHQALSKST